jgi:hypothetical protein
MINSITILLLKATEVFKVHGIYLQGCLLRRDSRLDSPLWVRLHFLIRPRRIVLFFSRVPSIYVPSLRQITYSCETRKHNHPLIEDDWRKSTKEMSTKTREEVPHQSLRRHWPQIFTKRRRFDRQRENQPYIEFLQTQLFDGEEEDLEDDISSDGNDDDSSEDENEEYGGEDDRKSQIPMDTKDGGACSGHSNVRLFMTGLVGDEETHEYRDQVEQVASFYEHARSRELETGMSLDEKRVALLDDRNIGGPTQRKKGQCRPYLGPLTSKRMHEELSKKVIQISVWQNS